MRNGRERRVGREPAIQKTLTPRTAKPAANRAAFQSGACRSPTNSPAEKEADANRNKEAWSHALKERFMKAASGRGG